MGEQQGPGTLHNGAERYRCALLPASDVSRIPDA
jgi:hypothetical protein